MKYRVTFLSVTVTGPPRAIWRSNSGTTEPDEPSTFPNRTIAPATPDSLSARRIQISATRLVAPITLSGSTALSVEIKTKRSAPAATAARAAFIAPRTLVRMASFGLASISGTCFSAAAWMTISGAAAIMAFSSRAASRTSPSCVVMFRSACCSRSRRSIL